MLPGIAADACTTFCLMQGERIVLAKNYDWYVAEGMLVVNKRGAERNAYVLNDRAAKWISKYGSVTFNQYGRDNPAGGMNEAGLVIELAWVNGTGYPTPDARPAVGGTGWVQYQLDTARNVAEVIASDSRVRIARSSAPLHYLVADREGRIAVVEFRDGKLLAHAGETLPEPVLANDFYAEAIARLRELERAAGAGATGRFESAARRARDFSRLGDADPVAYAFETLSHVSQKAPSQPVQGTATHSTMWSIVYEIDRGRIHFRTQRSSAIKSLALDGLDFSCHSPALVMDLNEREAGDVRAKLKPYSRRVNLDLIRAVFTQTAMLRTTPAHELERIAAIPEKSRCVAATLK